MATRHAHMAIGSCLDLAQAMPAAWHVLLMMTVAWGLGLAGGLTAAQAERLDHEAVRRAKETAEAGRAMQEQVIGRSATASTQTPGVFVVATFGLEDDELAELMADARRVGYPVVVRGVWRGSMPETMARLKRLAGERGERAPAMTIDPPVIRRLGVDAAPALVVRGTQRVCIIAGRRPLGELIGALAREWPAFRPWADAAARRLARRSDEPGRTDDLRWPGEPPTCRVTLSPPPLPLAEPDLADVLREAVLRHDWAAERAKAREETIRRIQAGPGLAIPRATRRATRPFDPTVEVRQRVVEPKSQRVLAEPGQRLNPLEHLPWTEELWIIDATDAAQIAWVEARLRPATAARILITRGDATELMQRWKRPVQWLVPELADRLGIDAVPAVVRAGRTRGTLEVETDVVTERLADRAR